jgi:hypothetical protein
VPERELVHSQEIVRRVLDAECRYTLSRMGLLERLPGNPIEVEHRRVGDAYAFSARHLPTPGFNRVVGLTDAQASEARTLVDWFEARGINGRFEITPGLDCPAVLAALHAAGYAHAAFHAVLFGAPAPAPPPAPGVSVEVVDQSTLEDFLDCYSAGWQVAEREGFKNNVRGWLGLPGWTLYLGRMGGQPAGGAILFMDGMTAYCADSAVDPARRGHGVHQALLARRRADALAKGADLVCAKAAYLSTSQRNMIRAGLSLLHVTSIWMRAAR